MCGKTNLPVKMDEQQNRGTSTPIEENESSIGSLSLDRSDSNHENGDQSTI